MHAEIAVLKVQLERLDQRGNVHNDLCTVVDKGVGGLLRKRQEELQRLEKARSAIQADFDSIIGRGGFGEVCKGTYNGSDVALKKLAQIGWITQQEQEALAQELIMQSRLQFEHVARIFGFTVLDDAKFMIIEFCEAGSLDDLLDAGIGRASCPPSMSAANHSVRRCRTRRC